MSKKLSPAKKVTVLNRLVNEAGKLLLEIEGNGIGISLPAVSEMATKLQVVVERYEALMKARTEAREVFARNGFDLDRISGWEAGARLMRLLVKR